MCALCEETNRGRDLEPKEPGLLESGTVGMGVAFSAWAAIAVFGGLASIIDRYDLGTESLVICLVVGFAAGLWARLRAT